MSDPIDPTSAPEPQPHVADVPAHAHEADHARVADESAAGRNFDPAQTRVGADPKPSQEVIIAALLAHQFKPAPAFVRGGGGTTHLAVPGTQKHRDMVIAGLINDPETYAAETARRAEIAREDDLKRRGRLAGSRRSAP